VEQDVSYQHVLQEELWRRKARNPAYSLRAFAKDIGLSMTSLSLILRRKQGLSAARAQAIAKRLSLDDSRLDRFIYSVKAQHSKSQIEREIAAQALTKIVSSRSELRVKHAEFKNVAHWFHFAIVECVRARPTLKAEQIAKLLSLELRFVKPAMIHLQEAGILTFSKSKWSVKAEIISVIQSGPSRAIRDLHHEVLQRAQEAIERFATDERILSTTIFCVDPDRLEEMHKEINRIRRMMLEKYASPGPGGEVFCFAQQLFPMTKDLKKVEGEK
jgi:uncharacterized protein (TIGR02147 family)